MMAAVTLSRTHGTWVLALGACMVALALREVSAAAVLVPVAGAAVALAMPLPATARAGRQTWLLVTSAGLAGFLVVRVVVGGAVVPVAAYAVAAGAVAGVAEELIFRRGLYGLLERWGPMLAVCGSAFVFALVHVPAYGPYILPINLAAGVVFGWQRWATGSWTAPAVTHALVNVVQSL